MPLSSASAQTTPLQGLNADQVAQSRAQHGSNTLTPPPREALWRKFAQKFTDPIILILLVALLLSLAVACYEYFVMGEETLTQFLEPAGVGLAILLATGVAFYFELQGEKEFALLHQVNEEVYYKTYREGQLIPVLKAELVVGDLVRLDTGEEVPADGVLLESIALEVDESSLTGEPHVHKSAHPEEADPEATYPTHYLCRGTTLLDGHALLRIERVGDATEHGRVFEGIQMDDSVKTPLNHQLEGLAQLITKVSYGIAALVLLASSVLYVLNGGLEPFVWAHALSYFLQKTMIAVTIIVVAVPEGLPMSVTLSLAYSMRSMMKTHNLVRRMHACETMGAATVICTDKTGTLTQNRMRIAQTAFDPNASEKLIALSIALNSTAHLELHEGEAPCVLGNPTEGALLLWLHEQGVDYRQLRQAHPLLDQLTFSTERKYMASVVEHEGEAYLLVKGAPELLLPHCSLSPETQQRLEAQLSHYQARALRTIAFAWSRLEGRSAFADGRLALHDLSYLGLVGIADPIRPEVPEAIAQCLAAGIAVKIITGDTAKTAQEIGRQIGLWDEHCTELHHITGAEFAALSDEALRQRVQQIRIMSRARPMDKERFVRLLQAEGEVVAVTGDGTNDAPALRRAQVGLSMGDGTAVAKAASDITILDNSFASITQAVMWGRSLYLNIQRFVLFQMTINVAACLIVLLGAFLGTESPLTVTQMLWVNLIMDTFAALALASLPPSRSVMAHRPRSQTANIISGAMARRIFGMGLGFVALLVALLQYFKHAPITQLADLNLADFTHGALDLTEGKLSSYELTLFFSLFVLLQCWNLFNAKAFGTQRSALAQLAGCRNFLLIVLSILGGQLLITSWGGEMFRVVPLSWDDWLWLLLLTSPVLLGGELLRLLRRAA